jgi:hypothetical protein
MNRQFLITEKNDHSEVDKLLVQGVNRKVDNIAVASERNCFERVKLSVRT